MVDPTAVVTGITGGAPIANATSAFINLWNPAMSSTFSWQAVAVLGVLISVGFAAIAYMLASAFKSEETKKWAKGELYYAFTNVYLIAFVIIFMALIGMKMIDFSGELARMGTPQIYYSVQGQDPIVLPLYYINKISDCVTSAYVRNYCFNFVLDAVTATSYGKETLVSKPGAAISTVANTLVDMSHIMSMFLTDLLLMIYVQKHLLFFFNGTMLTIFLPLGIVMRTFLPTRSAGNLFIGLALGFGIVYPLAYGMVLSIQGPQIEQTINHYCGVATATTTPSGGLVTCGQMLASSGVASAFLLPYELLSKFSIFKLSKTAAFLVSGVTASYITPQVTGFINQSREMAYEIIQYVVIYPLIVFGITFTFIRSFTIFLGGDAQEFLKGVSRLI